MPSSHNKVVSYLENPLLYKWQIFHRKSLPSNNNPTTHKPKENLIEPQLLDPIPNTTTTNSNHRHVLSKARNHLNRLKHHSSSPSQRQRSPHSTALAAVYKQDLHGDSSSRNKGLHQQHQVSSQNHKRHISQPEEERIRRQLLRHLLHRPLGPCASPPTHSYQGVRPQSLSCMGSTC